MSRKDGYFYGIKKPFYAKPRIPWAYKTKLSGGSTRENHLGDTEYFVTLEFTSKDRFTIEDIALALKHRYMVSIFWEGWRFFWEMNDSSEEKTTQECAEVR